jgi:16S rRNA (adenine1518-N6/adenine1519-N6)-dimethyltransferase
VADFVRLLQRSVDFPSATESSDGPSRPAQVF